MSRKPIVTVIGAGGRLGRALLRSYIERYAATGFTRAQLDLAQLDELHRALNEQPFDILINAAALTNVDYCETHRTEAIRLNAEAPRVMAKLCRERGADFIHFSTDYVFDGRKREPYTEEDLADPISVYGESKLEGEKQILEVNPAAQVVRVSWVFGPDRPSFVDAILKKARDQDQVSAVADKFSTPTYTEEIATLLEPFLEEKVPGGILHLANQGACSWQEYAQWAVDCCRRFGVPMKATTVQPILLNEMTNFVARRPIYTVLGTKKYQRLTGRSPRDWHDAVEEYVRTCFARETEARRAP